MTSTHRLVTALTGIFLTQSVEAWAQNPDGEDKQQIIEAIRFEGAKGLNEEALRSKLGLKENEAYDSSLLKSDKQIIEGSLQDQGYTYARIQGIRMEPVKAGRRILVYEMDVGEIYHVSEVRMTGNHAFKTKEIASTTHCTAGRLYRGSDLKADEKMIIDYYNARGYEDAKVETRLMEVGKGLQQVRYEISEGKRSLIQDINISGNGKVKAEFIRKELKLAAGDAFDLILIGEKCKVLMKQGLFKSIDLSGTPSAIPGFMDLEVVVKEQ